MKKTPDLQIFTDGACSGNPGPGGFGVIMAWAEDDIIELGGAEESTTNNRMEMTAAIVALHEASLHRDPPRFVRITTDSKYLIDGMTSWIHGWLKRGWKNASKQPVKNRDLWEALHELSQKFAAVEWVYVAGHSGHPANDRCDEIAVAYSRGEPPALYKGPRAGYSVDLPFS